MNPPVPNSATRRRNDDWRDDVWTAVGIFAIGALFLAIGVTHIWGDAPGGELATPWSVLLLGLAAALLLFKRRHPVLTLVAVGAVFAIDLWFGEQLGVLLAMIEAIHSSARRAGETAVRVIRNIVMTTILGSVVLIYLLLEDIKSGALMGLQMLAIFGTPYGWGLAVRREDEATALVEQRARDERRLAEVEHAQALRTERNRMAGDLHDALSGDLSAIAIHTEALLVRREQDDAQREALDTIRETSLRSLSELRSMVTLLRADDAQPERTTARLPEHDALLKEFDRLGLRVGRVDVPDSWDGLPAVVDQAAHRIVQESLANAAKHTVGAVVDVELSVTETHLCISVRNSGEPAASVADSGAGVGLLSMRERTQRLGGEFDAGWEDNRWTVRARIPFQEGAQ